MSSPVKKYLTIDYEKKVFTIDDSVKATAADKEDKQALLQAGYKMRHKSQKRAKAMKERAEKAALTKDSIMQALKDKPEQLEKFQNILKTSSRDGGGWFAARAYYVGECKDSKKK